MTIKTKALTELLQPHERSEDGLRKVGPFLLSSAQERLHQLSLESFRKLFSFLSSQSDDAECIAKCAFHMHDAVRVYVGANSRLKLSRDKLSVVMGNWSAIASLERLERPTADLIWNKAWLEITSAAFVAIKEAGEAAGTPLPNCVIDCYPHAFKAVIFLPDRAAVCALIPAAKKFARHAQVGGQRDRDHVLRYLTCAYRQLSEKPTRKGAQSFIINVEDCYRDLFRALDSKFDRNSIFRGVDSHATFERLWGQVSTIAAE